MTLNDPGDTDSGPNKLQNFPVLSALTCGSGQTQQVLGTLNSTPSQEFTIDFYRVDRCDASGYGEGENPLGSTMASTDASGNANVSFTVAGAISPGASITATATDESGNISEFAACVLPGSVPGETTDLRRTPGSKTTLMWSPVAGAGSYTVYAGGLPSSPELFTSNPDSCVAAVSSATTSGSVLTQEPGPGEMIWYLVRAANACREGPAGNATGGPRVQNTGNCNDGIACTVDRPGTAGPEWCS